MARVCTPQLIDCRPEAPNISWQRSTSWLLAAGARGVTQGADSDPGGPTGRTHGGRRTALGPRGSSRSYGVVVTMAASWPRAWLGFLMSWPVVGKLVTSHQIVNNSSASDELEVITLGPVWTWHPVNYPDPRVQPEACGRPSPSTLCDPEGRLSKQEADDLDNLTSEFCGGLHCSCGSSSCLRPCPGLAVSVAIVTTPGLGDNEYAEDFRRESQQFADYLRTRQWLHGACVTDILILLPFPSKNEVFLSVGERVARDLAGPCDDAIRYDARRNLRHNFHVAHVLKQVLKDLRSVLRGNFKCDIHHGDVLPTGIAIAIIFASVCVPLMLCVVLVFLGPCFRGRGFGGKAHKADNCKKYRYHSPGFSAVEETMVA